MKIALVSIMLSTPALAQTITLDCAVFTSGGTTDGGVIFALGVPFAGEAAGGGIELDAGIVYCLTGTACPADLDSDGVLTIFDFLAFQNAFDAMEPVADFDGDGAFTLFDFLAFQNAFDAGCS